MKADLRKKPATAGFKPDASQVSPLLRTHLAKLLDRYLLRPDAIEVCINRPGEAWIEHETGWDRKNDPALTVEALDDFLAMLATVQGQAYSQQSPILATTIPGYGFRLQAVGGAVAESGIALSIRCGRAQRFALDGWFKEKHATDAATKAEAESMPYMVNLDEAARLIEYIKRGSNILVAGPTGSGKTTLMNSMMQHIPMDARLGLVEDAKEMVVDQPNHFRLLKSKTGTDIAKVSYEQIIDSLMRMRPDRILMGEIDMRNTVPFLLLMNTGHRGCMATIHANEGADAAIRRMVLNAQLGGLKVSDELVRGYALQELDAVVFVEKKAGPDGRRYSAKVEYLKG